MVEIRQYSPRTYGKHKVAAELTLILALTCVLSYAYLERYWIPEVPEVPTIQEPTPFTTTIMDGPDIIRGLYIDITNSDHTGSYQEIPIYIGKDWDCMHRPLYLLGIEVDTIK